jgi:pantoate--beta-alanine ligase
MQFGPHEDLESYPRNEARDLDLAEEAKADVAFLPRPDEVYPRGNDVTVSAGYLGTILEGAARPGHFDGVATVVAKLFNMVRPTHAYFGQKDAQQLAVVRRLVEGLGFPLEIVACPTVREPDGLALSSRNAYLSDEERHRATVLWRALSAASDEHGSGGDPLAAAEAGRRVLDAEAGVEPDYLEAVSPDTFQAATGEPILFVAAARIGTTRLIDNLLVQTNEY